MVPKESVNSRRHTNLIHVTKVSNRIIMMIIQWLNIACWERSLIWEDRSHVPELKVHVLLN